MRLRADVAYTRQGIHSQLTLDREKVVLVIRVGIAAERRRHSSLRQERRKVDALSGIRSRCVQRWERHRKRLRMNVASCRSDKRGCEQRARAGVTQAIRRLRLIDRNGVALNYG